LASHPNQPKKARSLWGSLSRILGVEGATPRVSGMFCKAVVQAVLLHCCESPVLTDKVWKVLETLHNGAACRIAKRCPVRWERSGSTPLWKKQEKMLECAPSNTVCRRDRTGYEHISIKLCPPVLTNGTSNQHLPESTSIGKM